MLETLKRQLGDLAFYLPLLQCTACSVFQDPPPFRGFIEMTTNKVHLALCQFTVYKIVSSFSLQLLDSEATKDSHAMKLMMRTGEALSNLI